MIKLTDYYADWCGPCKSMAPVIEELMSEFPNVELEKVNIDNNMERVQKAGIMSVPTFVVERDGKIIFQHSGAIEKDRLRQQLVGIN